jgi:tetratricopeptide (TPR) repeat protein
VQSPHLKIFVSSTWRDLELERKAVESALQRLRETAFVGMEYFGSRDENTRRASLDEVDACQIYVGIFAARYGSGITEDEYRRARARGLRCFIYFKDEATIPLTKAERDAAQIAKLDKLKIELREAHTATEFINPEDLAAKLATDLHRWIVKEYLSQDTGTQTPAPPVATPHQLRAPVSDFVGREKEIDLLINALRTGGSAGISGISGMGGIGKTELALLVANRTRPDYPDAQLFIDMRGTSDKPLTAADALAECIRAIIGADAKLPEDINELVKIYRNSLDGKRALILLDNAADSAQVRPLLPPPACALLVTSRETLALPGMKRLALEQLQPQEARDLLTGIASRTPPDIADQICHLCGYLPLAIRAAGSLLDVTPDLAPVTYVTQLHDERERLKRIGREGVDLDVEASFELSYARLPPETALVFRQLAVFPASFDATAEEAICQDTGHAQLSALLRRNLVLYNSETSRYRLHDLVRLFADSRLSDDERDEGQLLHAVHYCTVLRKADDLYLKGGEALMRGLVSFDSEWANIQAGQSWAKHHVNDNALAAQLCARYPEIGAHLLDLRQHPREHIRWLEEALSAARRLNDRNSEAVTLGNLGLAYADLGELPRAIEIYEQQLTIAREIGDRSIESPSLCNLGNAYALLGELQRAIEFFEQHLAIVRELGNRRGEGMTLGNLGNVYDLLGKQERAVEFYEQSLTIARETGDRRTEGNALSNLGTSYAILGELQRAIDFFTQALIIGREIGHRRGEAYALYNISITLNNLGDRVQAIPYAEAALNIFEQIEDPYTDKAHKLLAQWRDEAQ